MAIGRGFYLMHRGWHEHPIFGTDPFSRRDAWSWMIENACWQDTRFDLRGKSVTLRRGQLSASRDQLAQVWKWSPSAVERFLGRLQTEQMIGRETGQGRTVITICNYVAYQSALEKTGQPAGQHFGQKTGQDHKPDRNRTEIGQKTGQEFAPASVSNDAENLENREETGQAENGDPFENRTAKERRKELNITPLTPHADPAPAVGRNGKEYRFAGRVIKLNDDDFETWQRAYHAIPDLAAALQSLDDWFRDAPVEKQKQWFRITSGNLKRKHDEAVAEREHRGTAFSYGPDPDKLFREQAERDRAEEEERARRREERNAYLREHGPILGFTAPDTLQ